MYRAYGNIRRMRQILTVLARYGFSHFLHRMRFHEYAPWIGRLIDPVQERPRLEAAADLPARLAQAFQELGPTFIKLGQLLATRPDIVPADFQAAFARLQDDVAPLPPEQIIPVIERSLGGPIGGIFRAFDRSATASGSIGQVHFAELPDASRVVVKIRRPGIEKTVREDLDLLEALAGLVETHIPELAVIRPRETLAEFRRVMEHELDFVGEASYTAKFRSMFADNPVVTTPMIHWEHVTHEVLVMERLAGESLAKATGLATAARTEIASALAECFMRQYFIEGFFHADPHPGNIFVLPDGRVGLIDFGQAGRLSADTRHILGLILASLNSGDTDAMAGLYAEIGEFSPDADIGVFRQDLANLVDRNYGVPADRVDFANLLQEVMNVARRNGLHLPRPFVLFGKSLVTIAGVIRGLDPGFRLDAAVRPFSRRLAVDMYNPAAIAGRGWRTLAQFATLARRVPEDVRDLVEKARAGKFTIVFHHENLDGAVERTSRAMDRFTVGVIIAAVIIGSSIILVAGRGVMPASELPVVGTAPLSTVMAVAGFIGATLAAAYVAWGIFRDKN